MSLQHPTHSITLQRLPSDLSEQVHEIVARLGNESYIARPPGKTRREDGSVWLANTQNANPLSLTIRLNAYEYGVNAHLKLELGTTQVTPCSLMVRPGRLGGDDRSLVSIPQLPMEKDLPLIENMVYAACVCIQRGQIGKLHEELPASAVTHFSLFLPSQPQLARFTETFSISGLPSLY